MAQLSFKWPLRPSHAPEDFIASEANEEAVRFLQGWPDGHSSALLLSGPEASGKTHLTLCWAARLGARVIEAGALAQGHAQDWWGNASNAVLEDIHTIPHETALFHLLRHGETHGLPLLLTTRMPAPLLPFTLPDLRSRLLALPAVSIREPDEELLKAFLFKSLSDRQLRVSAEAINYLAKRMERSFAAADALTARLEAAALASGRDITVPLARSMLT